MLSNTYQYYFEIITFQSTNAILKEITTFTTNSLIKGEEYFDLSKYVMTAAHDHKSLYLVTSLISIN